MNQVINRITLDVNKTGTQAFIPAKKNESNARTIAITLTKNGRVFNVEDGNTVIIRAVKPDNTVIYNAAELLDGKIYVDVTQQMCTSIGRVLAEVQIIDSDNNVLYTPKFYLIVEGIVYEDETITSTSEYTQLTESINQAQSAIETAQDLSLIERVTELPETGDTKKVYVLEETIPLMVTTGLPEHFKTQEAYEAWVEEDADNCASLFKTSDGGYVLFEGLTLKHNSYSDNGMYYIKNKYADQPVEYYYHADTQRWEEYAPIIGSGTAEGDPLIASVNYTGTTQPWEQSFLIDDTVGHLGLLWVHGTFTSESSQASADYTDSDNTFNIYDGISTLSGVGISYIWDEAAGWILVSDNKEVKEDLEELEASINTQISDIERDITDIETDVTGIHSDITGMQSDISDISASVEVFTVHYTFNEQTNTWSCTENPDDIDALLKAGKTPLPILTYITPDGTQYEFDVMGSMAYKKVIGPNSKYAVTYWLDMFSSNNIRYSFGWTHILGLQQINGGVGKISIQGALTAGNNITIENNVISATGSNIITPIYTYDSLLDVWNCNTFYTDIIDAYNNNKTIIPIIKENNAFYVCNGLVDVVVSSGMIMYSLAYAFATTMNVYMITHHNNNNVEGSTGTMYLQQRLTAGDGIDITNGVISVSYDNGDSEVY